jgi:hypothetical protein
MLRNYQTHIVHYCSQNSYKLNLKFELTSGLWNQGKFVQSPAYLTPVAGCRLFARIPLHFFCCQLCRLKVTMRWPETARCGLLLYIRSYTRTNCSSGLPWHPIKYLTMLLYVHSTVFWHTTGNKTKASLCF